MKQGVTYRHYKGGLYSYLGEGRHSETGESLVFYQSLIDNKLWVRPHEMFFDDVKVDGEYVRRFKLLKN